MAKLENVFLRDTRANQPAVGDVAPGTLYYVTDESALERNSGSAWESVSPSATVDDGTVTNAKLADMATNTIKGRNEGTTGVPEDLSVTEVTAMLSTFVGDSGSGGTKGLVPAPASGDAAAGKYLDADGTWTVPAGGGGGSSDWDTTVTKALDETVTSSITLQDDDELSIDSTDADSVWLIEALLVYSGAPTGDFKVAFAHSSGSALDGAVKATGLNTTNSGADIVNTTSVNYTFGCASGGKRLARLVGLITMPGATSPGNFVVQWAQNTSDATGTVVHAGSILRGKQLV